MHIKIASIFAFLLVTCCVDHHFFVHSQSSSYVVEILDLGSLSTDEDQVLSSTQNCTPALAAFADAFSNLMHCTILNARPIRVCTSCEKEKNDTEKTYKDLQMVSNECYNLYFESDNVGIVNQLYGQGTELWLKNNCQDCYNHTDETKEFFEVSKNLDICMKTYNKTSTKNLNSTCDMCGELFVRMNVVYRKFVQGISTDIDSGGVCVDIVDQMNITRHIWMNENCLRFDSLIGYPNIVTAVVVGCIPAFFYLLSKNVSSIEDVKLVRPKRKGFTPFQSESLQAE